MIKYEAADDSDTSNQGFLFIGRVKLLLFVTSLVRFSGWSMYGLWRCGAKGR